MDPFFLLSSGAIFASVALPAKSSPISWIRRLFAREAPAGDAQSSILNIAPSVTRQPGWTVIRCDDEASLKEWLGHDERRLPGDEEPALGSHLLIELYGCPHGRLADVQAVGTAMRDAADRSEATTVATSFHEFEPYGVSGAVIIQESHYTIHTWPEHEYAAVDLFYCGGTVRVHKAVETLRRTLQPQRMKFLLVRRGLRGEVEG